VAELRWRRGTDGRAGGCTRPDHRVLRRVRGTSSGTAGWGGRSGRGVCGCPPGLPPSRQAPLAPGRSTSPWQMPAVKAQSQPRISSPTSA